MIDEREPRRQALIHMMLPLFEEHFDHEAGLISIPISAAESFFRYD